MNEFSAELEAYHALVDTVARKKASQAVVLPPEFPLMQALTLTLTLTVTLIRGMLVWLQAAGVQMALNKFMPLIERLFMAYSLKVPPYLIN